jgi:hypothetical protein
MPMAPGIFVTQQFRDSLTRVTGYVSLSQGKSISPSVLLQAIHLDRFEQKRHDMQYPLSRISPGGGIVEGFH